MKSVNYICPKSVIHNYTILKNRLLSFETNVRGANTFLKRKYNSQTWNFLFDWFPSVFPTFSTNKRWWWLRASFLPWKVHPWPSPRSPANEHVATVLEQEKPFYRIQWKIHYQINVECNIPILPLCVVDNVIVLLCDWVVFLDYWNSRKWDIIIRYLSMVNQRLCFLMVSNKSYNSLQCPSKFSYLTTMSSTYTSMSFSKSSFKYYVHQLLVCCLVFFF